MRNKRRTLFTALTATAILAVAVGTASARNLRISEKNFEFKWVSLEWSIAGTVMSCPLTLLGGFEASTIAKVVNSRIGGIHHGEFGTCSGGTATILREMFPWEISYQSFAGTLPRITSLTINLIGLRLKMHPNGSVECLFGSTAEHPAGGIASVSSGTITDLRADETRRLPLGGGFICSLGGETSLAGAGNVSNLPGTASITVTLI